MAATLFGKNAEVCCAEASLTPYPNTQDPAKCPCAAQHPLCFIAQPLLFHPNEK